MLNRLTGWLLCSQVAYVTLFALLAVVDKISGGSVFRVTAGLRKVRLLENNLVRLSDYLYYPMTFTVPLNLILMLVFCGTLLRQKRPPALGLIFSASSMRSSSRRVASSCCWCLFSGRGGEAFSRALGAQPKGGFCL